MSVLITKPKTLFHSNTNSQRYGLTYEKPIILSVKDLIYLEASKTSFDENIDAGSTIASLSVDQDPNILYSFTLVDEKNDNDNNLFSIVNNKLKINSSPDYEIKSDYTVRIKAESSSGSIIEDINFSVNDLEEIKTTTWPGLMFSTLDISKNTPLSDDHNTVKIESFHYAFGNIGSTIRKVDKNGEEIWNKRYLSGYSRDYQNTIVSCDEDRFGNIWLTGYTGSTDRYRPKSAYWQKLSPDGTFLDGGNFGKAPRMPEENYSGRTSWFVPNSIHINKSGEAFVSGSYDIWWLNNNSSNGGYHKVTYPNFQNKFTWRERMEQDFKQ